MHNGKKKKKVKKKKTIVNKFGAKNSNCGGSVY
jgi:hypothetical protein